MKRSVSHWIQVCMLGCLPLITILAVHASEPPPVGVAANGWLGWSMNIDESSPPRGSGLDQKEFSELLGTIQQIALLFRRLPVLNPPTGVEVSPDRTILPRVGSPVTRLLGLTTMSAPLPERHPLRFWPGPEPTEGKGPVRAELTIGIYRPVYHARNAFGDVRVQLNNPWLEGRYVLDDEHGGMYLPWPNEEYRDGRVHIQVDRNTRVVKILTQGREPWVPVSQERWIRTLISKSRQMLDERRIKIVEETETRRQAFMRSYEVMKGLNAEEASKMLGNFEAAERIYAAQAEALARADYDALEAARERGLATVGRHLLTLESELAGLSAEEKAAPAYGFESNPNQYWLPSRKPRRPSLLMDRNDRNALPLLAPNPDYFRKDLPPGAIQSITVINRLRGEFLEGMEKDFDWSALRRMIR